MATSSDKCTIDFLLTVVCAALCAGGVSKTRGRGRGRGRGVGLFFIYFFNVLFFPFF